MSNKTADDDFVTTKKGTGWDYLNPRPQQCQILIEKLVQIPRQIHIALTLYNELFELINDIKKRRSIHKR